MGIFFVFLFAHYFFYYFMYDEQAGGHYLKAI